jgi:hypothetical protein
MVRVEEVHLLSKLQCKVIGWYLNCGTGAKATLHGVCLNCHLCLLIFWQASICMVMIPQWLFFGEQSAITFDERGSSKILAFDDFAWAYAVRKQSIPLRDNGTMLVLYKFTEIYITEA